MAIYIRIKYLLERRKLEQKELAKVLGVSTKQAHNYINGHSKIIAEHIPIIAKFLKVPIEYLFKEDNIEKSYPQIKKKLAEANDTSPDYSNKPDKCTNPECLLRENQLLEENRQLRKQKDKLNEELAELRKGGTHDGKSSSGGVGKREAG